MDSFTLAVFLIMLMLAISQEVTWAVIGLAALMIFLLRSAGLGFLLVIGILVTVMWSSMSQYVWIILAVAILGVYFYHQSGGRGPGGYSPNRVM